MRPMMITMNTIRYKRAINGYVTTTNDRPFSRHAGENQVPDFGSELLGINDDGLRTALILLKCLLLFKVLNVWLSTLDGLPSQLPSLDNFFPWGDLWFLGKKDQIWYCRRLLRAVRILGLLSIVLLLLNMRVNHCCRCLEKYLVVGRLARVILLSSNRLLWLLRLQDLHSNSLFAALSSPELHSALARPEVVSAARTVFALARHCNYSTFCNFSTHWSSPIPLTANAASLQWNIVWERNFDQYFVRLTTLTLRVTSLSFTTLDRSNSERVMWTGETALKNSPKLRVQWWREVRFHTHNQRSPTCSPWIL